MTVSLVYETHSLTEDNASGHATGWLPGKLSAEGRRLAAELGARRRNDDISAVFASDLARAVQTATIAFRGSDIPILLDWRLRECNYGERNGMPVAELHGHRRDHLREPFPGGQSYVDVLELTRSFLADLARNFDGRRVCVIAHSANKWALDVLLKGKSLEDLVDAPFDWREGWEYEVPNN
ncbi:MAG: histidine phosphatase family protein [Dehalococcoidia bacterium]